MTQSCDTVKRLLHYYVQFRTVCYQVHTQTPAYGMQGCSPVNFTHQHMVMYGTKGER